MNDYNAISGTYNGYYEADQIKLRALPVKGDLKIPVSAKSMCAIPWSYWRPGRVWVENGVAHFPAMDEAKAFMVEQTKGTIYAQFAETLEWPNDAVYRVGYMVGSWPCGLEDKEQFFTEPGEVIGFLSDMRNWSLSDGNSFTLSALEEWDLGPTRIQESALRAA